MSKETQQIIEKLVSFGDDEKAILATVVDVVGSGYRRPGARMLIDENGYSIGTVSGGCLEADVLARAKKVLQTGEPTVITYDTAKTENSVFGLGMGCRGIIRILLEPFEKDNPFARTLKSVFERQERRFIATVISSNRAINGGRIFYSEAERFKFVNLPDEVESLSELRKDCLEFFAGEKSTEVREYKFGVDIIELFFENFRPPLNLLLFGAGHDALPLIKFAKELGWRISVIDHRPAYARAERLELADEIIAAGSEDLNDEFFAVENSAAVIMTHNIDRDREILRRLMASKCRYIGALGPKKRTEKLLAEIGGNFTQRQLARLHAPVGLDIGAETPEAIALAIVAEIQAVLSKRAGGFLRERKGSIYGRAE